MINSKKILLLLSISVLLINFSINSNIISSSQNDNSNVSNLVENKILISASYTPFSPITIFGDTDFATQASINSWVGNGSIVNPYIIQGYNISGSGTGAGIFIDGTNVSFTIKDNYIFNSTNMGICIQNLLGGNILIKNNFCIENYRYGIFVKSGNANTTISDNYCAHNKEAEDASGIYTDYNCIILNNTCEFNFGGITTGGGIQIIYNNTCNNNARGIDSSSSYSNLTHNILFYNRIGIFSLYEGRYSNIMFNNISYNHYGLLHFYGSNCRLINNNSFIKNDGYAIFSRESDRGSLYCYNNFIDNNHGGIQACDDTLLTNNRYNYSTWSYNFWSDHTGTDANSDGYYDNHYSLDGIACIIDLHPLVVGSTIDAYPMLSITEEFFSPDEIIYTYRITSRSTQTPIVDATVTVTFAGSSYLATDLDSGYYEVVLPYISTPQTCEVKIEKTGIITQVYSYNVYVDPPAVNKPIIEEFGLIILVIGLIALVGIQLIMLNRRK